MVVKIWTKQPWVKIENLHNFDPNFALSIGKNLLQLFLHFLCYASIILHKKIQIILSKNEGVMAIFPIQNKIKIRKNRRHAFILLEMTWYFFV